MRPNNYFAPGKNPTPPDIHRNFISGPLTVISEEADRFTGAPARVEVYRNILVSQYGSVDPFPVTPGGDLLARPAEPNHCDLAMIATADAGANPDVCDFPKTPFVLNP